MSEPTYEQRLQSQIDQYAQTVNMHDLPNIFHIWSENYIGPGLKEVFGVSSIDEAYANAYTEARQRAGGPARILSIGCGDGGVEIRVAKILRSRGVDDFVFVCADVSPILLSHLASSVERMGLGGHFQPVECDLNRIQIPGEFDVIMANHSLHHIEGLEMLFAHACRHLRDGGIFATCDIIGRNGHQRWPEAAAVLQAAWPMMRPRQQYQRQLQQYNASFVDHDCSLEGFEGVRAQDILGAILKEFYPYKFFATGGFVDLLVDRGYGHGFDINNEQDVAFITFMSDLNEILLDAGLIKPTWMMAYFTKDDRGESYYRQRRARTAVRGENDDPAWTKYYRTSGAEE